MDNIDSIDEELPQRTLVIFGTDLAKIPCFRNSFLYGIGSGLGAGLLTFMCTSRPRLGTHTGMGTFMSTTLLYWFYCRYQWSAQKILAMQIQEGMRMQAMYQGTERERLLDAKIKAEEA